MSLETTSNELNYLMEQTPRMMGGFGPSTTSLSDEDQQTLRGLLEAVRIPLLTHISVNSDEPLIPLAYTTQV